MKLKELLLSIAHIRNLTEMLISFFVASIAGILGYFKLIFLDNIGMFEAVTWVVAFDFVCGVSVAIKQNRFQTQKALKVVYYLAAYWFLVAMVLKVEQGFPSAFWLSEALIMPILVGQIISSAKNLSLLGLITNPTLVQILDKIDKHKELVNETN